jgi:hypothetical protein
MSNQTLSIILAIVFFLFIAIIGFTTDILKEQNKINSKYSFHRFQLWIWTLVICPIFCLHWGYMLDTTLMNTTAFADCLKGLAEPITKTSVMGCIKTVAAEPLINNTSLILLGISTGTMVTSAAIGQSQANKVAKAKAQLNSTDPALKSQAASVDLDLKLNSTDSEGFFIDILTDDKDQISAGRLQNLVFTIVFVAMYISCFFSKATLHHYIDWDNDSTPFVLMGISSSAYLVGKSLKK